MILRSFRSGGVSFLKISRESNGGRVEIAPRTKLDREWRREGEKRNKTLRPRPPRGIYTPGKLGPNYPGVPGLSRWKTGQSGSPWRCADVSKTEWFGMDKDWRSSGLRYITYLRSANNQSRWTMTSNKQQINPNLFEIQTFHGLFWNVIFLIKALYYDHTSMYTSSS